MALVRVYCGLASADLNAVPPGSETWLTVAVVDDSGRLLDICDISDDASGFAELGALLAERSNGLESVAVATDSDEHIVARLLIAAGRYLAYTDEDSAEDYAERFSDAESADEMQSSPAERRAIGLARALQAGVLSAVAQPTPRDLIGLKPVLAAHAAVTTGRQGAAATLREVLRELYPAALRAFPDPAEPIPLAILDALPEPGPLGTGTNGRGRDAQAIAELTDAGVSDSATLTEAVTSLRVAIAETPRRTGMNRSVTSAVAETVRQSVAAVRACDAAADALVSVLSARMPGAGATTTPAIRPRTSVATVPGTETYPGPAAAEESARPAARRTRSASVRPRSAPPAGIQPRSGPPAVQPQSAPPATPAAATTATTSPAAPAGSHRAGTGDVPAESQAAPRTRAARRAAEKQAAEQQATHQPTPVSGPAPTPVPVSTPAPAPTPVQAPPASLPVPPPASIPTPINPAAHTQPEPAAARPQQVAPVPPGLKPAYTTGPVSAPFGDQRGAGGAESPTTSFTLAPGTVPTGPAADVPPSGPPASWPLRGDAPAEPAHSAERYRQPVEPRVESRRTTEGRQDLAPGEMPRLDFSRSLDLPPAAEAPRVDLPLQPERRVVPPWQSDDLPAEPPALRLVEPAPMTDPALTSEPPQYREPFAADLRLEPPALRLVEPSNGANGGLGNGGGLNGSGPTNDTTPNRGGLSGAGSDAEQSGRRSAARKPSAEPAQPPTKDEADGDLLIFAEARSAWFTDHFGEDEIKLDFASPSDEGWRAASHAAEPAVGTETESGLPRRVPQQNLVPGSPVAAPERPLRVVRDPAAIAAHTSGYFRGWRRGQEVGGYRVGGRPGRESSGGWDFSRDQGDDRDYEYRSARR
ncbi:transposase [Planosporangium sp. 12N6]|uniref:transposase n=1 Tax=Planosporangium spinosum TaxID=3402278 RepID=UPI003CFAB341